VDSSVIGGGVSHRAKWGSGGGGGANVRLHAPHAPRHLALVMRLNGSCSWPLRLAHWPCLAPSASYVLTVPASIGLR